MAKKYKTEKTKFQYGIDYSMMHNNCLQQCFQLMCTSEVQCPKLNLTHSMWNDSNTSYKAAVEIECEPGDEITKDKIKTVIRCQEDATWSFQKGLPLCKRNCNLRMHFTPGTNQQFPGRNLFVYYMRVYSHYGHYGSNNAFETAKSLHFMPSALIVVITTCEITHRLEMLSANC